MPRTPFHDAEKLIGATFGEFSGWQMPRHFASLADEVASARQHGGIVDLSNWSKLKISGADAADFLHNYTSQNIKTLAEGQGLQTAVTTWKGTMLDHVFVYRLDDGLRVIGHPETAPLIRQALEKYLFGVDVEIEDLTEQRAMLYVFGPHAAKLLEDASGESLADLPMHAFRLAGLNGADSMISRTWSLGQDAFTVLVPADQVVDAFQAIRAAAEAHETPFIGMEAFEILRIESGMPSFPQEINEDRNPWEVRLADSVSMNKGCYLGQEVIARLANYQKVQRHMVGLRLSRPVEAGLSLLDENGKTIGLVTSVAFAPDAEHPVALGFVKTDWAQEGRKVKVASGESPVEAEVRDLPFWQDLAGGGVMPRHG